MTEYECDTLICSSTDTLNKALRIAQDLTVDGINGVLTQIADASQLQAKKWIISGSYKLGDVVVLNGITYLAAADSQGKSPDIYRSIWNVYQLPYTQNEGKLKGYLVLKTDGTIIKSYNIASVTEYSNSRFLIYFTTPIDQQPICIAAPVETALTEMLHVSFEPLDASRAYLNIVGVSSDQTALLTAIADNNSRYIVAMFYGSGNVLP